MKDELILAIESSCDETAAAIIRNGKEIVSNVVSTQIDVHKEFGGVIPEVASRIHVENISMVIEETLKNDKLTDEDKKSALSKAEEIAGRIESEGNIESLLKAKGFEKTVAIISDTGISVVVESEGLTSAQTLQIQDVVTSETNIPLSNIKIVPIK